MRVYLSLALNFKSRDKIYLAIENPKRRRVEPSGSFLVPPLASERLEPGAVN